MALFDTSISDMVHTFVMVVQEIYLFPQSDQIFI